MNPTIGFFVTPLIALISVTGCGQQQTPGAHTTYALGILWNNQAYEGNQIALSQVGKMLGTVQKYINQALPSNDRQTISNEFPIGTKLYEVPGKALNEAIACRTPRGTYVEIEVLPFDEKTNS